MTDRTGIDRAVLAWFRYALSVVVLAGLAIGCDSSPTRSSTSRASASAQRSQALPLEVFEAPTPRIQVPNYRTSGTYPQVQSRDVNLGATNAAIRRAVLEDQESYARSAHKLRAELPYIFRTTYPFPGVYRTAIKPGLTSASTVVVSTLMRLDQVYPGGNHGQTWLSVTVRVPSGATVEIDDLFADPSHGLESLAGAVKKGVLATNDCTRETVHAEGFEPTAINYRHFALTTKGLAFGFADGQLGAYCGPIEVTVPYAVLRPYLSKLGATLIAGVRRPGNVGPPPSLTKYGRLLWNFEALLRDTFGNRPGVSATTGLNDSLSFSCAGFCAPSAKYLHYRFTFANARGSPFHVSKERYVGGGWGNYPRGILIRGHLIACNPQETSYLFSWVFRSTASFTLGCGGDPLGR